MRALRHARARFALLALIIAALAPAPRAWAAARCFGETGHCVGDPFGTYWQSNGGLPVFGFPIAPMAPETSADTGQGYVTQWLERERLELHPENSEPYRILLGRLGAERLAQTGRDWTTFPKASPGAAHYFAVTGHAIAPQFWDYWRTRGLDLGDAGVSQRESLALFGYPLSEAAIETNPNGDTVLTQWFERARFEYHPGNPEPYKVLLGLLGVEQRPLVNPLLPPHYENRDDPALTMLSYYTAISRKEYQLAYSYWETPGTGPATTPPDYNTFVAGYANTIHVAITIGTPMVDAGAGNVYAAVPVALRATPNGGGVQMFAGCYILHRTNPGIDPRPDAALWKLQRATVNAAAANATPAALLAGLSCGP